MKGACDHMTRKIQFVCLLQQPPHCDVLSCSCFLPLQCIPTVTGTVSSPIPRSFPRFCPWFAGFCPGFVHVRSYPGFPLGFAVTVPRQTQLTILGNERTRSHCFYPVIKPGRDCLKKGMTMAFCCNQMQLWREADQNCVRMQFWTKMKTRPDKEKPNSCWVFTGFSPSLWKKPAQQPNRCFDRYVWKYYQGGKHKQLTEHQVIQGVFF